jgi:hypothetical protein
MKNCAYCGRENSDEATHCAECGSAFTASLTVPAPTNYSEAERVEFDKLVHDRPKLVIVMGIWAIFLPELLTNCLVIYMVLCGPADNRTSFLYVWLALGYCSLSGYVLYRVIKNYMIHKKRVETENPV